MHGQINKMMYDVDIKKQIKIQFGKDKEIKPSNKCWFNFSISGAYELLPVKLHLLKTNSLNLCKVYDMYRPVVRYEGENWHRHIQPIQFQITSDNQVSFHMTIQLKDSRTVYIANCYPWSLTDNQAFLHKLQKSIKSRKDIYFNKETLIYSTQNRPLHILALSSSQVCHNQPEEYLQHLFPNRHVQQHLKSIKKPVILITSRVHPGEVGASHVLNGILKFLCSGESKANEILKQFYFLIIPILNPDGVFNGNNRMDALGQNLNRFYLFPQLEKQPSCFAVKEILELVRHQLYAYFDLHGHSNRKSFYLYGNSIVDHKSQAQSVLFAQHLSSICQQIDFQSCNFSKKQMSSKDKNDDFSKEGCARVVVHRWTNSPYCYTLETSLYKGMKINERGQEEGLQQFYSPQTYAEVGKKMLLSIHSIFKNEQELQDMRVEAMQYVLKMEKQWLQKEKQKKKKIKKGTKNKEKQKKEEINSKQKAQEEPQINQSPLKTDLKTSNDGKDTVKKHKQTSQRKLSQKVQKESVDYLLSLQHEN